MVTADAAATGIPGPEQTPSPVPSTEPRRFAVLVRYGLDDVGTVAECDLIDTTLDRVVKDIVTGQYDEVLTVYELRDVSREIAWRVANAAEEDDRRIHSSLARFLRAHGEDRADRLREPPDREWEWEPDYFAPLRGEAE